MRNRNIHIDGIPVYYKVAGKGYPLVLIHGFGEDGSIWDNQIMELEKKFLLIIPDIPGSGMSDRIPKEDVSMDDYADCIYKILLHEEITGCIMIGHSMGGYITLAFEERFPGILRSFGLFHSSAYRDDEQKIETRLKAIDFIRANGTEAFLATSIPGLFLDPEKNKNQIDELLLKSKKFEPGSLIQYYKAMIDRPDRTPILQKTQKPVFIIAGLHDKAIPFQQSLRQSHIAQQTFINILRYSSHMGMLEETAKSNDCLRNILQAIDVN